MPAVALILGDKDSTVTASHRPCIGHPIFAAQALQHDISVRLKHGD